MDPDAAPVPRASALFFTIRLPATDFGDSLAQAVLAAVRVSPDPAITLALGGLEALPPPVPGATDLHVWGYQPARALVRVGPPLAPTFAHPVAVRHVLGLRLAAQDRTALSDLVTGILRDVAARHREAEGAIEAYLLRLQLASAREGHPVGEAEEDDETLYVARHTDAVSSIRPSVRRRRDATAPILLGYLAQGLSIHEATLKLGREHPSLRQSERTVARILRAAEADIAC